MRDWFEREIASLEKQRADMLARAAGALHALQEGLKVWMEREAAKATPAPPQAPESDNDDGVTFKLHPRFRQEAKPAPEPPQTTKPGITYPATETQQYKLNETAWQGWADTRAKLVVTPPETEEYPDNPNSDDGA